MGVGNFKGDETPLISTCESSRNFMNIGGQNSNPTLLTINDSEESKGGDRGLGKYTSEYTPN